MFSVCYKERSCNRWIDLIFTYEIHNIHFYYWNMEGRGGVKFNPSNKNEPRKILVLVVEVGKTTLNRS